MAICCIWIIVVGMNFKRKEGVLIIEQADKQVNIAKVIDEKSAGKQLKEITEARGLQFTLD